MGAYAAELVGGGDTAVDQFLFVDSNIGDGKGRVLRSERHFGGNIATALIAAARTGVSCAFLGHLPDDTVEPELLDYLRSEGVDLSQARMSPTKQPTRSTILVGLNGERFIAFDNDGIGGLPDDMELDLVRSARVLLLDDYGLSGGVRAATAARESGVAVVADIERAANPGVAELVDLTDHLVLPLQVALDWTGADAPAGAIDSLWRADRSAVVVTGGADGCWYRTTDDDRGDAIRHHAAAKVSVVDTTGCGDVFHGIYAAGLTRGNTVAHCVAEATLAAAHCATHPGGIARRLISSPELILGR